MVPDPGSVLEAQEDVQARFVVPVRIRFVDETHQACRAAAGISMTVIWHKPREYGAVRLKRFVLEVKQPPWANSQLKIPSYYSIPAESAVCRAHAPGQLYRAEFNHLQLGKSADVTLYAIAAPDASDRFPKPETQSPKP